MKNTKKMPFPLWKSIHTAILCLLLAACNPGSDTLARQEFIRNYLQKYPEATLQDIYKGSFQDVFGPAHLLTNREAVSTYIKHEMETAGSWENEDYVPCGWQGNFFQVNLKVIQDGRVPIDEFTDAFMASANGIDTTLTQVWINEWEMIQEAVRTVKPDLQGFSEDSTKLSQLLANGNYVVHHSRKFNEHYHPHYRIIRKDIFREKILPYLK